MGRGSLVVLLAMGSQGALGADNLDYLCNLPASASADEVARQEDGYTVYYRAGLCTVYFHRRKYIIAGFAFFLRVILSVF